MPLRGGLKRCQHNSLPKQRHRAQSLVDFQAPRGVASWKTECTSRPEAADSSSREFWLASATLSHRRYWHKRQCPTRRHSMSCKIWLCIIEMLQFLSQPAEKSRCVKPLVGSFPLCFPSMCQVALLPRPWSLEGLGSRRWEVTVRLIKLVVSRICIHKHVLSL